MESSINQLEVFLRNLCKQFDPQNSGICKATDFLQAIIDCPEIHLSKVQTYIIRSFIDENEEGYFNYLTGSRHIAAVLKNFDTKYLIEKKKNFIKKALIKEDDKMEGWS